MMINCDAMVCEIYLFLLDWTMLFFLVFGFGARIELLVFSCFLVWIFLWMIVFGFGCWFGFLFFWFWIWILDLDSGFGFRIWILDLDWILTGFLFGFFCNGRRVWIMPGKG